MLDELAEVAQATAMPNGDACLGLVVGQFQQVTAELCEQLQASDMAGQRHLQEKARLELKQHGHKVSLLALEAEQQGLAEREEFEAAEELTVAWTSS